ncbi:MAG: hypothetical protein E6R03_06870 [Hyphomicrobiaceae bacterium]|nr:MAG: hypothetical protein E6R03_06870 [Hyphomicrobiaceae bacterium]
MESTHEDAGARDFYRAFLARIEMKIDNHDHKLDTLKDNIMREVGDIKVRLAGHDARREEQDRIDARWEQQDWPSHLEMEARLTKRVASLERDHVEEARFNSLESRLDKMEKWQAKLGGIVIGMTIVVQVVQWLLERK